MSIIVDPQAVRFVNEKLRPTCDRAASALRTLRQFVSNYKGEALAPLFVGTTETQQSLVADGSVLADGSKGDGRMPISGSDVDSAFTQANVLIAWLDANPAVEQALAKPSVNTIPAF